MNTSTADGYSETIRLAMVELVTTSAVNTDLETTLAAVTAGAVTLMHGVDSADVMLVDNGVIRSVTPTDPLVIELDKAQQELQEGPCLRAATAELLVSCPDLRTETRWPRFAAVCVAAGVHCMLSFQLYTHQGGAGALNLFGRQADGIGSPTEAVGAMLATHAAIALSVANTRDQFHSALASRDIIGQAKGVLMERFAVDALRAFELLRGLSQKTNTPLRTIAKLVVGSHAKDHDPGPSD